MANKAPRTYAFDSEYVFKQERADLERESERPNSFGARGENHLPCFEQLFGRVTKTTETHRQDLLID